MSAGQMGQGGNQSLLVDGLPLLKPPYGVVSAINLDRGEIQEHILPASSIEAAPAIFLIKDFHPFLTSKDFAIIRRLKDIALHLKNSRKTIVLISPVMQIPAELDKEITVINFPPPGKEDLGALLDKAAGRAPAHIDDEEIF